eukprot:5336840-Amphidinium_carterae.1
MHAEVPGGASDAQPPGLLLDVPPVKCTGPAPLQQTFQGYGTPSPLIPSLEAAAKRGRMPGEKLDPYVSNLVADYLDVK